MTRADYSNQCLAADALLELQQELLALDAAAVPGQAAAAADHTVARHDDADRVAAVGQPDRAGTRRAADALRQFAVRFGLAVRDVSQGGPDPLLERRTGHR